ncbi:MAG: hypothetical protein GXY34_13130 [Syntrophomonadaceae bacterium]|nr:hypothetical protein [Syntrophomonadaceae bacterium]
MRTAIIEISILIAAFILGWLKFGWPSLFYISLGLIGFYTIVMVTYIIVRRSVLTWSDNIFGIVAMAGWLVIAWFIMHEKGIHFWGL